MQVYLRFTDYRDKVLGAPGEVSAPVNLTAPFEPGRLTQFIRVQDYSTDVEQTLNIGSQSTGAGAGKITFNPFSIRKFMDAFSPTLFQMAATGTPFKTAEVFFVQEGGTGPGYCIAKHHYKLVAVKTIAWSSDSDATTETVTFEYGGLMVSVNQQAPDGSMKSGMPLGWNRVRNVVDNEVNSVIQ